MTGDHRLNSETILSILADVDPDGIGRDELRRLAAERGIEDEDFRCALKPLMMNANIYFNASTGLYHFIWSSPLQWE